MAETKMAVEKEIGLFAHLCRQRNGAQKYSRIVVKRLCLQQKSTGLQTERSIPESIKKRLRRKMSFVLNYLKELDREYYSKWFKNILL